MSNSVMMQPFPEFPQIPRGSQTLPEATLERRVFMLGKYVERLENDFSQRFFDLEKQSGEMKKQIEFLQEQNQNILGNQIQLSARIELVRRTVGEHERQHAATKEELDEIYEDMKIREQSIASYREDIQEVTEYCSHVEKDAHGLRYEMKDLNVVVEDLTKDLKINKEAVDQIYLKNNKHAYLLGMAMERMDDLENALKRTNGALEGRELDHVESENELKSVEREVSNYENGLNLDDSCGEYFQDSDSDCNYMAGLEAFFETDLKMETIEKKLPIAPSLSSDIYEKQFPSL